MSGDPVRPPRPVRSDFVQWERATTRWADIDCFGHMNNARYFELIDTAIDLHLQAALGAGVATLAAIGVVAEVSCRYFHEVHYPDPIDLGLLVDHVGRSSVVYRVGLFQRDHVEAAAEGRYVHVYVDNTDPPRPVVPLPDVVRSAVTPLLAPRARPKPHPGGT